MAIWIKPNGNEIEINDKPATIEYAKSLNWKPKKVAKEVKKAKSQPKE